MGWKSTAREIPAAHMRAKHEEFARNNPDSFYQKSIVTRHGKPWVTRDHIVDYTETDEDGTKYIAASMTLRQGYYIFPQAYLHPEKRFVGELKDIRLRQDGSWDVLLDAVLRDSSGNPILVEGQEVDLSGWFAESSLKDAGLGMEPIRQGASMPSIEEIIEARHARIRRNAH